MQIRNKNLLSAGWNSSFSLMKAVRTFNEFVTVGGLTCDCYQKYSAVISSFHAAESFNYYGFWCQISLTPARFHAANLALLSASILCSLSEFHFRKLQIAYWILEFSLKLFINVITLSLRYYHVIRVFFLQKMYWRRIKASALFAWMIWCKVILSLAFLVYVYTTRSKLDNNDAF